MELPRKGLNFILSAPSAVGKSTIISNLLALDTQLQFSISVTTRQKRSSEKHDVDYHYKSKDQFSNLIKQGAFLEYTDVYGNYYGTLTQDVLNIHKLGKDVLFDIDFKGAENIKKAMPENSISIFILPPSYVEVEQRLRQRNQDSESDMARRLSEVKSYISHYINYDYIIVNDNLEQAIQNIQAIITASRLQREHFLNLDQYINNL
ncbi:Guanylate kinase [Candidatus Hepatincola sp. Pdp]